MKKHDIVPQGEKRISDGSEIKENIRIDDIDSARDRAKIRGDRAERKDALLGMTAVSAFLLLFLAIIFAICLSGGSEAQSGGAELDMQSSEEAMSAKPLEGTEELSVAEIYRLCSGGVVSISASKSGASGIGSGFVYSSDGYIATANHVIEGMEDITVIFSDGSKIPAHVVAGSDFCDIALLKVERTDLQALNFGDPSKLSVGDEVVAIGTPASLDYAGSVSSGVISYLERSVKIYNNESALEKKMTLIQTNAPLNPGNSGCPLLNCRGEVVGLVTMKLGSNYEGIGFAIPSAGVASVLEAMKNGVPLDGDITRLVAVKGARLGIVGESVKEGNILGIRILDFSSEYCDAALKLKKGDIVVSFDGNAVSSVNALAELVENKNSGEIASVTVMRSEQLLTFDVLLISAE